MIGTVICRNCDTAIEVSEGDVARFRTNPVFACSVCQQDLTQRVAEMLGRSPVVLGTVREPSHAPRASDPDEFTVPDDQEVFDGLPMGESFDDAALRLKAVRTPQATPVMADPQPEDPSLLALRIASQAQAQAQAFAAKALANAASVAPMNSPDSAATQPGAPNSPSTEVGVVPEEPENETTARRAAENGEGSVAEPTLPSDGGDDDGEEGESMVERTAGSGHDERTPLVDITRTPEVSAPAFSESGVLPSSPANEATPSVSRGNPVLVEEEPPREVTAKRTAPPPRIMRTTVPRTGTGPAGIGALGIRVVANRAVVRPASNGRSVSVPANAETQVTGVETHVERPSAAGRAASVAASASAPASTPAPHHAPAQPPHPPAVPFSSPRGGTARRSGGGASMWAMIGGGTLVLVIAGVFIKRAVDGAAKPSPTPYETPAIIETEVPPTPTPTETPDSATPAPTVRVQATVEPTRAVVIATPVFPRNTPAPTPQQTATVVRTATATPTVVASTPRPAPNTADVLREAGMKGVVNDFDAAYALVRSQRPHDPSNPEVHYYLWRYASKAKGVSADERMRLANEYLQRFRNLDADRTKNVETWVKENGVR